MTAFGGNQPVWQPGSGGFFERMGDRVRRRAEPRFGVALAGVGMLMIVVGVIAWAGEQAAGDGGEGDSNRTLGIILSGLVIAAGYLLLVRFRHGPLAAAGVAAATLGVPVLMGFVTFDASSAESDGEAFFEVPFQVDAIVLLSLAAWLATYLWLPVARGRVFFLAASTFVLWLYLLEKVEEGAAFYVLTLPYSAFFLPIFSAFGDDFSDAPDFTSIGGPSLVLGVLYYLVAVVLDRLGHHGIATPFVAAGFAATVIGIVHLAGDLEAAGTGVTLILAGVPLALYGALQGRRFTTWAWAFGIGLGVLLIVIDIFEDSAAGFGVTAILLGAVVVLLAHLFVQELTEPDEMTPGPSQLTRRQRPVAAAWAGYPQGGTPYGYAPPAYTGGPPQQPAPGSAPPQPAPPPAPPSPPVQGAPTAPQPPIEPPDQSPPA